MSTEVAWLYIAVFLLTMSVLGVIYMWQVAEKYIRDVDQRVRSLNRRVRELEAKERKVG